jgi:hypothetical protein
MPLRRKAAKKVKKTPSTRFNEDRNSDKLLLGLSRKTTFSYIDYISINPGTGTPDTFQFSCNGLFAPSITSAGHQPRGYDQIKGLFDHYTVVASTIKITFSALGTQSASFPVVCGVLVSDDNTVETDQILACENRKSSWTVLPANDESRTLYMDFDSKKYFGLSWKDDSYKGSINANPADQAFYQVFCQPISAVDPQPINAVVEIIYHAVWTEPANVQIS